MTYRAQHIKAIAFDLFGTLVQITAPRNPYAKLLAGISASPEQIPSYRRYIMRKHMGLAEMATALGGTLTAEQLTNIELDLQAELDSVQLFPETLDVLETLSSKGIKIGIASNLASPYELPVKALLPPVDVAVWSFRVGEVKPDAAFFRHVIDGFGFNANQILMVGDNPKNDIAGAKAMGMQAFCINRKAGRSESEIGSLWDVVAAVK